MKISPRKYAQALAQMLESAADAKVIIRNFLIMLRRKKQFRILPKILQVFESEWNRQRGIVKMNIAYPEKFAESVEELKKKLGEKLGKQIDVYAKPSTSLIGGLCVQIEDTLIDASIEGKLRRLAAQLR